MENYYFGLLTKPQQAAYHTLLQGLKELQPVITLPLLSGEEFSKLFFLLRLDHPLIFYTDTFSYHYYPGAESAEFSPHYLFDKKKTVDHCQAMQTRIRRLTEPWKGKSVREKQLAIHDFICKSVRYDKLKKSYSHEIIGPLGQGVGVCEGIAKTVKALCDALGIWCIIAVAEANPEKGIRYRHAWNIMKIDGALLHFDATFDLSLCEEDCIRYDYVNLCDKQLFRDHQPVVWPVPACTAADCFYYREQRLSLTKYEDVSKRAAQYAKKGKIMTFHWRGGYLTRDALTQLLGLMEKAAEGNGKHALVSVNIPQAVLSVRFSEASGGLTEQDACETLSD